MIDDRIEEREEKMVLCQCSHWIYTDRGGLLEMPVEITDFIKKGQCIEPIRNMFGNLLKKNTMRLKVAL